METGMMSLQMGHFEMAFNNLNNALGLLFSVLSSHWFQAMVLHLLHLFHSHGLVGVLHFVLAFVFRLLCLVFKSP